MSKLKSLLVLTIAFSSQLGLGQDLQQKADSLLEVLKTAPEKDKPLLYNDIARHYLRLDPFKVLEYGELGLVASKAQKNSRGLFESNNHLGIGNAMLANFDTSIYYFKAAMAIAEKRQDIDQYGQAIDNLGNVYIFLDRFSDALECKQTGLRIDEYLGDHGGTASSLVNIGTLFAEMDAHGKAVETYREAIAKSREAKDSISMMICYENLASEFYSANKFDSCNLYLDSATAMANLYEIPKTLGFCYGLKGNIAKSNGEYELALEFYLKELDIVLPLGDRDAMCNLYSNLGKVYTDMDQPALAMKYLQMGMKLADEIRSPKQQLSSWHGMAVLLENMGKYKEASEYYRKYISLKDSTHSEDINEQIARMEARFNDEKVQLENLNLRKEKALDSALIESHEAQANEQKTQEQMYAVGLILCGIVIIVAVVGFLQKKKANALIKAQKSEVEHQKILVEAKNKEIYDSIAYAKRIQDAILPPPEFVSETLGDSYILYLPKDIVAGDFYWIEKVKDWIIFAAADCTGHGVPGAMVSVVCHNALNRAVREFGQYEPAKILDKTRELVIETFERSQSNVKDGMDIAVCALNRSKGELLFSGANNSLYLVQKDELSEVKGDKQPIGKFETNRPFSQHKISVSVNDLIVILTDGYADQFGGEKGKKFKNQAFKNLLLQVHSKSMAEQLKEVEGTYLTWKSDFEQVDDVCVIGLRI